MKSSTKDNAKGEMHQLKGKIKDLREKVGNRDLEAEGKKENLEGKNSGKYLPDQESLDK